MMPILKLEFMHDQLSFSILLDLRKKIIITEIMNWLHIRSTDNRSTS